MCHSHQQPNTDAVHMYKHCIERHTAHDTYLYSVHVNRLAAPTSTGVAVSRGAGWCTCYREKTKKARGTLHNHLHCTDTHTYILH